MLPLFGKKPARYYRSKGGGEKFSAPSAWGVQTILPTLEGGRKIFLHVRAKIKGSYLHEGDVYMRAQTLI